VPAYDGFAAHGAGECSSSTVTRLQAADDLVELAGVPAAEPQQAVMLAGRVECFHDGWRADQCLREGAFVRAGC
jgi:hypothetical protein